MLQCNVDSRTPTILVLDDDSVTRRILQAALERDGLRVETFGSATHARAALQRNPYDLYLLDVVLPDGDGLELLRTIRSRSQAPAIMLTTRGELDDIVRGLEMGADDYISKPFQPPEVLARVRAQLRRASLRLEAAEASVRVGDLVIDRSLREAFVSGKSAGLTQREFDVLDFLAARRGRPVSKDAITQALWDERDMSEKILAVYIRRLRLKLETDPDQPRFVHTVRGYGYRLVDEPPARKAARE